MFVLAFGEVHVSLNLREFDGLEHIKRRLSECPIDDCPKLKKERKIVPSFKNVHADSIVLSKQKATLS